MTLEATGVERFHGDQERAFEALRAKRREIAMAKGVPPYVVFHDSTLREMAGLHPTTMAGLAQVSEDTGDVVEFGRGFIVPDGWRERANGEL